MLVNPTTPWRLLRSGEGDGAWNMAVDQVLLRHPYPLPTLRLYRWNPWTLSLGYFQKDNEFDLASLHAQGFAVVRRPTGGSAIFHAHEITFSITLPEKNPWIPLRIADSYCTIHKTIQLGLQKLGVASYFRSCGTQEKTQLTNSRGAGFCFYDPTDSDLLVADKKLVGSAQRRSKGRLLHHGSIVLRENSITPHTASVETCSGIFDYAKTEQAVIEGFRESFSITFTECELTREEEIAARQLCYEDSAR